MSQDKEKLIDKIEKLLAKASGTESQEEALSFMAKAQELLLKHNLSMFDVKTSSKKSSIVEHKNDPGLQFGVIKEEKDWEVMLMSTIANFNMCHSIINWFDQSKKGGKLSIIGEYANVIAVKFMFETARDHFRRLSKEAYNKLRKEVCETYEAKELELQKAELLPYRMVFIRSYLKGCNVGLYRKMEERQNQLREQSNHQNDSSLLNENVVNEFELMLTSTQNAIQQWVEENMDVDDYNPKWKSASNKDAYQQGVQTGRSLDLNKGVEGTASPVKAYIS